MTKHPANPSCSQLGQGYALYKCVKGDKPDFKTARIISKVS